MWNNRTRQLSRELLDDLSPSDPEAIRSRRDLRRVNWWMGHRSLLGSAIDSCFQDRPLRRWIDWGTGDGLFMLELARVLAKTRPGVELILADKEPVVSAETCRAFSDLGWKARPIRADLEKGDISESADLITANLFLHHFSDAQLGRMFLRASEQCRCFLAAETRRSLVALAAARLYCWLRCNRVTQHDAGLSIKSGFAGQELSVLWRQAARGWKVVERPAGVSSHFFQAWKG